MRFPRHPHEWDALLIFGMFFAAFAGLAALVFAFRDARQANAWDCRQLLDHAQGTGLAADYATTELQCGEIY